MSRIKSTVSTLLAFALVATFAQAASTEEAWFAPPHNLSLSQPGGDAANPQVTVDSRGLATAVWQRFNGSNNIIQSSTSLNGVTWSTPVSLSALGVDGNGAQVTVGSNGRAVAVWAMWDDNYEVIQSSTSLNGAAWSSPVTLSSTTQDSFRPQVAVDADGLATAVWQINENGRDIIQSSTSLNGATWSTPVNLSETGRNAFEPQVAVDADGHATAVWRQSNGSNTIIQSRTSLNGATWSAPVNLSETGRNAVDVQLAVHSDGHATAVWSRSNGSNTIIQSSTSLNGATWSAPVNLSETGRNAAIPRVTVDSNNRLIAVWQRTDGVSVIIQSSNRLVPMPIGVVTTSSPAPQKQHVSTLVQTPAPGETVSMFGSFFERVTEVFVGGVKVDIVSKSDNRVNIRMPRGLTGALDVELKSPLGTLLLPKHFTIGKLPAAGGQQTTLTVGGFDPNSRKLTASMQARIDRWLERNSDLSTLTCTGFTSLPRRTTDVQLSTNRGTTACNFAKSQRPELTTSVSQGVEDPRPGSNVRRVKLVLTP